MVKAFSRKGLWDEKSKIGINKKTGKRYMTFWDRDRERYTTANSDIVSITFNIFQNGNKMKKNYWQDLVNKHLVGKKIVKVEWLNPKETERVFGWDQQPCEIYLEDGVVLTPSQDDEGNDAGAIHTNIKELPIIPTFRE